MPKPIDLSPEVAKAFMRDLKRYHATKDKNKRTGYAVRQMEVLSKYQKVTMEEMYEMFRRMRERAQRHSRIS